MFFDSVGQYACKVVGTIQNEKSQNSKVLDVTIFTTGYVFLYIMCLNSSV